MDRTMNGGSVYPDTTPHLKVEEALNTEFSRSRMVTKNYTADESAVTGNTE